MQSKPFQKQDIVAWNHQTPFYMPHYGQCESKLCRQTLLQCAFNKGSYCPGDAEWIWEWGLCRPGWVGPWRACSSVRPPSAACLLIPVRRASKQHRKLFAVRRTCQEIHNASLFILKILQNSRRLLKSQNDGFIDFPFVYQHLYDPVALTSTSESFLPCASFLDRLSLDTSAGASCNSKLTEKANMLFWDSCE